MSDFKKPGMSKLIDSGFDIEIESLNSWALLDAMNSDFIEDIIFKLEGAGIRPRLNKPQVLDDYSFIESLEGFVWDCGYFDHDKDMRCYCISEKCTTKELLEEYEDPHQFEKLWLSFKGVAKGSIYEQWAIENDIPIIDIDGET